MSGVEMLLVPLDLWRAGHVNLKKVALFGPITMVGAYLGAKLAGLVTATGLPLKMAGKIDAVD